MGRPRVTSPNMSSSRAPLVLALDIGTSSVRTALFDQHARRMPGTLTQREYAVSHSDDGAAELEPQTLLDGVEHCLDGTLARTRGRRISAVGVTSFWHSLVGTDTRGRPVTPIYTWADSRCREDAARLRTEMPEEAYHRQTGCMLRASFWPAKLRWLARTRPRLFGRVARWQSPADWLAGHYCDGGADACAYGMATGTGLFDPRTLSWASNLVGLCGLKPEQLCPLSQEPIHLSGKVIRRRPQLAGAKWWPAIGDGAASNLGSGATRPGRAAINVGTSAAFRVMRNGRGASSPFGLFCYRVDADRYVVGGAVSSAGNLRAWCRRELDLPRDEAALDRALSARPGPLSSLVTLPFWSAERAPTWNEDLRGVLAGLTHNTTALDILQATTEAVYHRLALIADLSLDAPSGTPGGRRTPTEIIVSGGILKSQGLLQRLADVLGRAIHPSTEPEATLRGAAVYALERSGVDIEAESAHRPAAGTVVRPRARWARLYARERDRQRRLETAISALPPL